LLNTVLSKDTVVSMDDIPHLYELLKFNSL